MSTRRPVDDPAALAVTPSVLMDVFLRQAVYPNDSMTEASSWRASILQFREMISEDTRDKKLLFRILLSNIARAYDINKAAFVNNRDIVEALIVGFEGKEFDEKEFRSKYLGLLNDDLSNVISHPLFAHIFPGEMLRSYLDDDVFFLNLRDYLGYKPDVYTVVKKHANDNYDTYKRGIQINANLGLNILNDILSKIMTLHDPRYSGKPFEIQYYDQTENKISSRVFDLHYDNALSKLYKLVSGELKEEIRGYKKLVKLLEDRITSGSAIFGNDESFKIIHWKNLPSNGNIITRFLEDLSSIYNIPLRKIERDEKLDKTFLEGNTSFIHYLITADKIPYISMILVPGKDKKYYFYNKAIYSYYEIPKQVPKFTRIENWDSDEEQFQTKKTDVAYYFLRLELILMRYYDIGIYNAIKEINPRKWLHSYLEMLSDKYNEKLAE